MNKDTFAKLKDFVVREAAVEEEESYKRSENRT
jgi:hypothetical protein